MRPPRAVPDEVQAEERLLRFLRDPDYRPVPQRELVHRLHLPPEERPGIRQLIRRLIRQGRIDKIGGGKLVAAGRGHGREGGPRGAASASPRSRDREVLGLFVKDARGAGRVQPLDPSRGEELRIPASAARGAEHLQLVRARRVRGSGREAAPAGEVLEVLGHLDEPGTDAVAVSLKHGLSLEFPAIVLEAAAELPGQLDPAMVAESRERFDDPSPVTIDGETARDFDDAVAVADQPRGGFRLFVHIADVAHFVPPDSVLDLEARARGTSVYFPDRVLPMFPEALSNGLCSLLPGEDRLVQSLVLDFTADGEVRKVRFADGVIRSAARLTYGQVAGVLDSGPRGLGVPAGIQAMLHSADRLRAVLERRRHARGSIDFDLPEPQILLDVEGVMTGIVVEPRSRAHRMIEEFMLAANDAVAENLERRGADCLFRVHEPPDDLKLQALIQFVEGFGVRLAPSAGRISPREIQALLERVEDRAECRLISQVALRTMMQARYSPDNIGHFGLASASYTHFTSPIRRYPDLVVHRQLRAVRQRPPRKRIMDPEVLRAVAESSSERERNAEAAERELLQWKKVAYIAGKVGEEFEGLVTGVTRFGLFVQLTESLVEGLIRVEQLGQEWFDHDEARLALVGSQSGKVHRLGDALRVRVDRVDRVLQRVDLSLASSGPVTSTTARRSEPRRRGAVARAGVRSGAPRQRVQANRRAPRRR